MQKVTVDIFSDVLCIWAYGAQARFDQLKQDFGDRIELQYRFIPLFAATGEKIGAGWKGRGGFEGFNRHIRKVTSSWNHVSVHPQLWLDDRPASSDSAHLFIKAVQQLVHTGSIPQEPQGNYRGRTLFEEFVWRVRCHFFEKNLNISRLSVLDIIAAGLGFPVEKIHALIDCGEASAALHLDMKARDSYLVPGSPTLVFNEGRQRLYGNIGYRIIEANVQELLTDHQHGEASWC